MTLAAMSVVFTDRSAVALTALGAFAVVFAEGATSAFTAMTALLAAVGALIAFPFRLTLEAALAPAPQAVDLEPIGVELFFTACAGEEFALLVGHCSGFIVSFPDLSWMVSLSKFEFALLRALMAASFSL
jgi:hypothetical protein